MSDMIFKVFIDKLKDLKTAIYKIYGVSDSILGEFVNINGVVSKPKDNKMGLLLDNRYILPMHDVNDSPKDINDNDILITDNKSYIYFDYSNKALIINSNKLTIDVKELIINATDIKINGNVDINGSSLKHNGINIGSTHVHGGVISGSSSTTPPT